MKLSAQQTAVLELLAAGKSVPQIASQMKRSVHTVKTHVSLLYDKFGVNNRAAAVAHAFRRGYMR